LITPKDEKFLDAFYFALRDTLVAGDIKVGTQIAFNAVPGRKFRVVTLAGEMIELSGVMSGGGRPKKGLMGNKIVEEFSQDQIREVVKRIQSCEQKLAQFRSEQQKYEQQKAELQMRVQAQSNHRDRSKVEVDQI
jgi:structural maintenance of chromosome 4